MAVVACGEERSPLCPGGRDCRPERIVTEIFQTTLDQPIDILLIIDDTPASASQQGRLPWTWSRLQQLFEMLPLGTPSLHVGVVSASRLDAPGFDRTRAAACGVAAPDRFLSTAPCGLQRNFDGTLEAALTCLTDLPAQPHGASRPIAAARRALDNEGAAFLRPTAALWLIIASAVDDEGETSQSVADFAAWLKSQRSNGGPVVLSVMGPPATCAEPSLAEAALVAPRLTALADAFGRGAYVPLCEPDPTVVLTPEFESIQLSLGPTCIGGVRDMAPHIPGLQPECAVGARLQQLDGSYVTAALPACESASPPCWRLEPAPHDCPGTALWSVDHGDGWCPQLGMEARIQCLGCVDANDPACALP